MYQFDETKTPTVYFGSTTEIAKPQEMEDYLKISFPFGSTTLDEWFRHILIKTDYDRLIEEIPAKLKISPKTWYNYRFAKTKVPHAVLLQIVSILTIAGYEIKTIEV